ncbi:MAG: hypothetical protein ACLPQY_09795 [Streptosporangiaceae bacterium]
MDPPPRCLDLGNGEAIVIGTATDMRAAAEYLSRTYPDGTQGERYGPVNGPVLNMGYELYRMIRDGAPGTWTGPMIHVAQAIADDARDPDGTQDGLPWSAMPIQGHWDARGRWRDGLTERTGMSARAIRRALADLAEAGFEMRQQIATDGRGRPLYAAKGHAVRFQVPALLPRAAPQRSPDPAAFAPVDNSSRDESADVSEAVKGGQGRPAIEPKVAKDGQLSAPKVAKDGRIGGQGRPPLFLSPPEDLSPQIDQSPQGLTGVADGSLEVALGAPPWKIDFDGDGQEDISPAEHQSRELARIAEWARQHPEAAVASEAAS